MLFDLIKKHVKNNANHIAIVDEKYSLSYEELWQRIISARKILGEQGIGTNSRVVFQMQNNIEWVLLFLALLSLKAIAIPLSQSLTTREYYQIINKVKPFKTFNHFSLDQFKTGFFHRQNLKFPRGDEAILFQPTSGSTGDSKIVIRTLNQLVAEGKSYQKTFNLTFNDKIINVLPLYHSYALGFSCIASLVAGATLKLVSTFSPRSFLEIIEKDKGTIIPLVPSMVRLLTNVYLPKKIELSSVRFILVGTGPVSKDIILKIKERFNLDVYGNYGSTETGGIISRLDILDFDSIGYPMKNVEIKIVNEEGKESSPGEVGELFVKTPAMMKCYLDNDDEAKITSGYLKTGDLIFRDKNGRLFVVGRKKELVSIGGKKVYPKEISFVISLLSEVQDNYVYSVVRKNGEVFLKALVVASSQVTKEILFTHCRKHLSQHKIPTIIEKVDKIPRNEMGKLIKNEIY